jgi:RNA 2',3'-cyclic 3'-phosphodiesterase
MSETTRTFVAIAVPEPLGRELAALQALLATDVSGCRWTENLPFHTTLVFLGDVRNSDGDRVCESINSAAGRFESFELSVEGLGAFPSVMRPRVIWAGVVAPNMKPIIDLREAVVDAVTEIGYGPDDLRFHPHVMLGRIKPGLLGHCDLTRLVERYRGWPAGSFPVEEVTTFASTHGPRGPIYTPIGRAHLRSSASPPSATEIQRDP